MSTLKMPGVYNVLPKLLDRRARLLVFEFGCHNGFDTAMLRSTFPGATIIALEPDPRNAADVRKRKIEEIAHFIEAAVGDRDGEMEFHLSSADMACPHPEMVRSEQWTASSSLKRASAKSAEWYPWLRFSDSVRVPVVRFDTIWERLGGVGVDLVWSDIQGAEDLLIAGGQRAFAATSYFYTEYEETAQYEGQIGLEEIRRRLPGEWDVLGTFENNALLRNRTKLEAIAARGSLSAS
jgi:FkbM family methyltransferase